MVNELPSIQGVAMVSALQYLRYGTYFFGHVINLRERTSGLLCSI